MNGAASRRLSNSVPPTLLATMMPIAPVRLKQPIIEPRIFKGDCWAISTELVMMQPTFAMASARDMPSSTVP